MPGNNNLIDSLAIEVVGQAQGAMKDLEGLIAHLEGIKGKLAELGSAKIKINSVISKAAIDNLRSFSDALKGFDTDKLAAFGSATQGISKINLGIGEKSAENLSNFSDAINMMDLGRLRAISEIDFSNMRDLADASRVISKLRDRVKELEKTEDKTAQTQEKLAKSTVKVTREARKASSSFNFANTAVGKLFNSIKRIAFYRAIRSAIKAVTQGFAEGIENLYYWSQMVGTSFAPRMDQLATATQYLKNGFASMWSPLIEYAIPIIDNLIDRLVDMFNVVQELFARLTGAATWNKALKYPVTYKDALDDASGSAKALQNILMDFDEINAINTPKSGSRGSGADAKDYSAMFQLMETPTGNSPLGKFGDIFNDVRGKVETAYVSIKKFWDFFKGLNFKPMMDSASGFWDTVSPIIDDIIADADWVRAKVLQPVTKFLVEEGIPAAIDTLGVALDNLWAAFTPIKEGAKDFWDKNGDWILDLTKGQIRTGLDKIKEAFKEIGEFFSKNKSIKKIFDSLGSMAKRLSPVILAITDLVGSDGWQTFVDGVQTILDLLDPILESAAGVFELLDGIVNFDPDKMASGLETILRSITKSMLNPLATVMDLLGRMFDGLAKIAGWFGWDDLEKSFKETADLSRANADEIRKWGDEFSVIGKKADTAHAGITNGNKGAGASFDTLESKARQAYDSIARNGSSAAQQAFNAWYNSTNSTKAAIDSLPTTNANAIMRIKEQTASLGQYIKNVLGVDVANFAPSAGYTIGSQLKVGIENGLRNLHLNIPATVNIVNTTGSTAAARVHGATFDMNMFASGGFLPSQYSLFAAGEGGVPEMLGTVGGRTAVAGGAEITGIREAIVEQGQREEGLLRSLISAVQNKDLSLVANSATGRWVNRALKAYSGVSG